jgi:2-(1,2-epoxy-1,2-dihydrophenyl)acetyl-CoA isomerase
MADRVRELAHDDEVRCVVVTGEGDAFCAGLDMAGDMGGANPAEELETGFDAIARGLIRIGEADGREGARPGGRRRRLHRGRLRLRLPRGRRLLRVGLHNIGLAPDTGATDVLPRLVGTRTALGLLITGDCIDAAEAVELGVANEVVPGEELDGFVADRAETLAGRPTKAVAAARRLVYRSDHRSLEETLREEALAQEAMIQTEDFIEGVVAFMADREPAFEGR